MTDEHKIPTDTRTADTIRKRYGIPSTMTNDEIIEIYKDKSFTWANTQLWLVVSDFCDEIKKAFASDCKKVKQFVQRFWTK